MTKKLRYWNGDTFPRRVPDGRVLAHNHITHTIDMPNGLNGFRCWTWPLGKQPDDFMRCPCGWSGLPHYAHRDHITATGGKCISDEEFEKANGFTIAEAYDDLAI
jgi:hypothetical protein